MVTLRRVGLMSAGRMGFWLGMAFAIVQSTIFIVFLVALGVPFNKLPPDFWWQLGIGILFSSVSAALSYGTFAFLYNMTASMFGGLKLEFDTLDTPAAQEKRKNGPAPIEVEDEDDIEDNTTV